MFDPSTLNATQLSISLLFAWTQFWFFDEQIGKNQDKSIKEKSFIDFYQLMDTIDVKQIRFTDFYRLINRYRFLSIDYSEVLILKAAFWSIKPRKSGIVLVKGLCDEFTIWYVDISGKLELYLFSIIFLI